MRHLFIILSLIGTLILAGCNSSASTYTPVDSVSTLTISFEDAAWDGKIVPEDQICKRYGGEGATPALKVSDIPVEANALIVEFSDGSYKPMDNGGHGKIGIMLADHSGEIVVPIVAGETESMPPNLFMEQAHKAKGVGEAGAYLPPCSGGQGNRYYATVKAVYIAQSDGEESKLLAEAVIEMGTY